MFLQSIQSKGLAHNSYFLAAGTEAAIVDPSRDVDRYIELAISKGYRITKIFETHRNEDYVSGAAELKTRTGAKVFRGFSPEYTVPYAESLRDGTRVEWDDVSLQMIATPGHTDDSVSIAVFHRTTGKDAVAVFTGDALFVQDVGRTDFYPNRAREVAGLLYESLHTKLLPLGDQAEIYPAHGAGSVCGSGMADRTFSTIGYERKNNPRLQLGRDAFIEAKLAEHHYYPPYFKRMERANQGDHPELACLPYAWPLTVSDIIESQKHSVQLLDLREDSAIAGATLPGAIAIPLDMLSSFGGWFLNYDQPIVLVVERPEDVGEAIIQLVRLGYDRIQGYLAKGFEAWATAAQPIDRISSLDVHRLKAQLARHNDIQLIDVRATGEYAEGHIEGARHVYVGEIEKLCSDLDERRPTVTYCASGRRALVAAAALKRIGFSDVSVCWGSMKAWKKAQYPITVEEE